MIINKEILVKTNLFILTDANIPNMADTNNYTDDHTKASWKLIFNV